MKKMKKIYKITSCDTDVHEDSWKHGEGDFCNSWTISDVCRGLKDEEFDSLCELLTAVAEKYLVLPFKADPGDLKKHWFRFDLDDDLHGEIRFDNDCLVDADNDSVDDNDIKLWKKGKKKLYCAHTCLFVKAEYVKEATDEELIAESDELGLEVC